MPEYYGYQAPEQPNFGKSIANVAELFAAAEEKRAAKRETEQKSLDEARKKINEIEQSSNQSVNGLVNNGANSARDYIYNLEKMRKSGQITGAEFNRAMTNINDSWDNFAFATKNMNERLAENLARQQVGEGGTPPPASSVEMKRAQIQSDLLNTKDKTIVVGNDGDMYMVDKNNPDKPISLKSLGNLENIVHNRIDVGQLVQNGVSKFGDFTVENGIKIEKGPRTQELYNQAKYDLVHSIVNEKDPASVVSILVDNMGADYDQYYNNTEKQELLNDAVAREEALKGAMTPEQKEKFKSDYEKNNMIEYKMDDNGVYQPVVTKKMLDDAYSFVDRTVEMQVGGSSTEEDARTVKGGGPSGPKNPKVTELEQKQLAEVRDAWNRKDVNALRRASNDQYYFKWGDGGIEVYDKNPNPSMKEYNAQMEKYNKLSLREKKKVKEPTKPETPKPLKTISRVDGLYEYFYGKSGEAKWLTELERQRGANTEPVKFNGPK